MGTSIQLLLFLLLRFLTQSRANTYSVTISTEQHVNLIDSRFLSFTVDPKFLFSSNDKYSSKECSCMAAALTPAYLRIAGPSTAHLTFLNTTISINDVEYSEDKENFDIIALESDSPKKIPLDFHKRTKRNLAVSHRQWNLFVQWAKSAGFDLVFALNNEERTASGLWDPNTALNILTVAEKVNVGDMFWELGYECRNQSIEEYLNDLETLRVIIGTFPQGRTAEWKVVAGDVTKCLQTDSKSDFREYVTLSSFMMDALLLNGNSSSQELERMTEYDRMKLLRILARSPTPLWLTETNHKKYNELERAADWLASLGYSAKNGFAVHYRELQEDEMYEPTLSFYMALLFKNLVGERVLDVQMEPEQAVLFAHCTSLRHKQIPGAVTLFAVNMDEEPARFSLKLAKREEGGDIMQFILGKDHNGNIAVNGRPMFYEGYLKPVVKRVQPYRTLVINLPANSFGFWVLARTNVEACYNTDSGNKTLIEAKTIPYESHKAKRSLNEDFDDYAHVADLSYDFQDNDSHVTDNLALTSRIHDLNRDLFKIQNGFKRNIVKNRSKRYDHVEKFGKAKLRGLRQRAERLLDPDLDPRQLIDDLLEKARQRVSDLKSLRPRGILNLNRVSKRHSKNSKLRYLKPLRDNQIFSRTHKRPIQMKKISEEDDFLERVNRKSKPTKDVLSKRTLETRNKDTKINQEVKKISREDTNVPEAIVRRRRSVDKDVEEISAENDIDLDPENRAKLWKILKRLHKEFENLSEEKIEGDTDSTEGIVLKTELSDDSATIKVKDSNHGVIKSTMKSMLHVLEDLNKNLNKVWDAINLLN
ncbi:heparanase [Helicoverpa armigera]|uniref:heparanase n=1 Tax=Helicoverpa armigera TaxID=29058 RepID=UPI003083D4D1